MTEADALDYLLAGEVTTRREPDLIRAIQKLETLLDKAPALLRVLYLGLYDHYRPLNCDVWERVGDAVGKTKNQAWRRAHPAKITE